MEIKIRPVAADEVDAYIRAVPGAAGLPTWEPEPAAWWAGPGHSSPFGSRISDKEVARYRAEVRELDRTQAAFADGKLVGTSGLYTLEVTVPGARQVAMGGVTSVGVLPTHRRRGLLRGMMRAMLDDCHARGEVLAGLSASEGGIYGRYGFGPATATVRWELDRAKAQLASGRAEWPGRLELVDSAAMAAAAPSLYDAVRQTRVGQVSAAPGTWPSAVQGGHKRFVLHYGPDGSVRRGGPGGRFPPVDGAAIYRYDLAGSGTVQVDWFEASSADAYTALWLLLADLDLTKRVAAAKRPVDEPLHWQLADTRALRVTRTADDLWIRLVDVGGALAARTYLAPGSLVLEVTDAFCPWNTGRWLLDGGPEGASCTRAAPGAAAELALDAATLGSLYLGGTAPGTLARAGLIHELVPGALNRAAAMLAQPDAPFNPIGF